jgi:hypothetical protein
MFHYNHFFVSKAIKLSNFLKNCRTIGALGCSGKSKDRQPATAGKSRRDQAATSSVMDRQNAPRVAQQPAGHFA